MRFRVSGLFVPVASLEIRTQAERERPMLRHKLRLLGAASVATIAAMGPAGAQSISREKIDALEPQTWGIVCIDG